MTRRRESLIIAASLLALFVMFVFTVWRAQL
jgi:hypothetical protein